MCNSYFSPATVGGAAMKPMLARKWGPKFATYPAFCQPKLNGVRALYHRGVFQSRDEKLWQPGVLAHLLSELSVHPFDDILDGELYVHGWRLQDINAAVAVNRKEPTEATPSVEFHVFDVVRPDRSFSDRWFDVYTPLAHAALPHVRVVPTALVHSAADLDLHFHQYTNLGYEGVMIRPDGPYEFGEHEGRNGPTEFRSKFLWKRKQWEDGEFVCVGTTHGEGKADIGIGALVLQNRLEGGDTFKVGTGLTDSDRVNFASDPPIGKLIKVRYLELTADNIPFNPSFLSVID